MKLYHICQMCRKMLKYSAATCTTVSSTFSFLRGLSDGKTMLDNQSPLTLFMQEAQSGNLSVKPFRGPLMLQLLKTSRQCVKLRRLFLRIKWQIIALFLLMKKFKVASWYLEEFFCKTTSLWKLNNTLVQNLNALFSCIHLQPRLQIKTVVTIYSHAVTQVQPVLFCKKEKLFSGMNNSLNVNRSFKWT